MTTRSTRILAGSLLVAHGIPEEQAETILRAFTAADLDIVKRAPAEPVTGPKAPGEVAKARLAEMRAVVRGITPTTQEEA